MNNHSKIPDENEQETVRLAAEGDYRAFEILVTKYESRIYFLAFRMLGNREDAEDIVQETFLNVSRSLKNFRGDSSFYTWLIRIARNIALKLIRKKRKSLLLSMDTPIKNENNESMPQTHFVADWRDSPDVLLRKKETRKILQKALDRLNEKYKEVFLLRDVEGLSVKETALIMDISESNVKTRLLRARLMLREELTKVFGDNARKVILSDHEHKINGFL